MKTTADDLILMEKAISHYLADLSMVRSYVVYFKTSLDMLDNFDKYCENIRRVAKNINEDWYQFKREELSKLNKKSKKHNKK